MTTALLRRSLAAALLGLHVSVALAADLTVSAAASLTNAFRELGPLYEARNPGTRVVFNFAASDTLLAQIARGAPADVFASADQETMDRADARKLLTAGSRRNFVGNTLVMVVPADSALGLKTAADLQKPSVLRVAIGDPASVPVGRYTKSSLETAKLWAAVEPKAVFAQNVRQALDYVARGEVEAGFVYATDAALMKGKARPVATLPTDTPITYPIAAVAGSPNPDAARQFIAFALTPAAQAVLARHGFGKPDDAAMESSAWITLALTLKVAGWATAINLVLGVAVGWWLARRDFIGREFVDAVLTLPLVLPPTVLGYYLLVMIGKRGWFGQWLHESFGINLIFTWQGAVIATTIVAFPLLLRSARAAFEAVDPQLEQAARVLGLNEWAVFFRITLPMAWPGVLAGTLLVFARSLGEFGATLMVAGSIPGRTQTLSIAVYEAVQAGQDDTANFLVTIVSVTCIVVLLTAGRFAPARRR